MVFLQPWLLWLLPLAALPVIIHLLNRMRFRTVEWAASRFLYAKSRASTRHARVRQWLLLACRVLALLTLVLAVARPLAGGWAGWMLSPAPDAVLILMDHSASMETRDAATGVTRRERALEELAQAMATFGTRTRCILIENIAKQPEEVAQPALLPKLPEVGPTDTAADLPGMFDAAAEWLARNRTAVAEIWIASDLQQSNWQPESPRWREIAARIAALPQRVRVRLLAMDGASPPNASVTLISATRDRNSPNLSLTFDIRRSDPAPATLPVTVWLDGARAHLDLATSGASTRIHQTLPIAPGRDAGSGRIELPPDGNDRDNAAYFAYAPPPPEHIAVICPDAASRASLVAAADPFPSDASISCDVMDQLSTTVDWSKYAAVIWADALPEGDAASRIAAYAQSGGAVIFFPGPAPDAGSFLGAGWGQRVDAPAGGALRVTHWDQHDGPLADAEAGTPLSLPALRILRAEPVLSGGDVRAALTDDQPLLTERITGGGRVYFCGTLPRADWSTLGDGDVLVPMLQRIIAQGAARFSSASALDAGDAASLQDTAGWINIDGTAPRDVRSQAGIYRKGERLAAVNRPAAEDDPAAIAPSDAHALFVPLNATLWEDHGANTAALQGEIWRSVLFAMLIFLIGESFLSLPPAPAAAALRPSIPVGAAS